MIVGNHSSGGTESSIELRCRSISLQEPEKRTAFKALGARMASGRIVSTWHGSDASFVRGEAKNHVASTKIFVGRLISAGYSVRLSCGVYLRRSSR